MASTKNTPVEDETTEVELTDKQIVNAGIDRFIEALGMDGQKARYKAQRAIAFQAFLDTIESGTFDDLVDAAIANVNELPTGWEIAVSERTEKPAKAPAKAKAAPAKAATKAAPAKVAARPARRSARPAR